MTSLDFGDTAIAFANKSDQELKKTAWLFRMMNNSTLVNAGSTLALWANKLHIPLTSYIFEKTIFYQFCGGKTLLDCQPVIDKLYAHNVFSILDYGAEAKQEEREFDKVKNEIEQAIMFAASNPSVPVVSLKVTALADDNILAKWQSDKTLNDRERMAFGRVVDRLDSISRTARDHGVKVFMDAEESWMQDTIDYLVRMMMQRYNRESVVVYDTFQLYRWDQLDYLQESYEHARKEGYILGAKLVRGAYMNKERARAEEMGYQSPIQPDAASTDRDYNAAVKFCVEHYETMSSANASHNQESNRIQAELIVSKGIQRNHPSLNFCQLMGMSDHITFNLAEAGFNVGKYVVYGKIREVIPYLIRRAQENTAVTGDMSRELQLITKELERRGLN